MKTARTPSPSDVSRPEHGLELTEEAVEAAANQLRSQLGDFTSPDILMRKRARMVLRASIRHLRVTSR